MTSFEEALNAPPPGKPPHTQAPRVPDAWRPGVEYDHENGRGVLVTRPLEERPRTWDAFIEDAGLDPAEVQVVGDVQVRGWDMPTGGGNIVRAHYYRLNLRRRGLVDVDELLRITRRPKAPRDPATGPGAFVLALGDTQFGKVDGDGPQGTWQRALDCVALAEQRYRALRRKQGLGHVHIAFLGDCLEGFVSQGGRNAWRTVLTLTEQIRLTRRLMLETVRAFAPLAERVTVVSVPGNHDEAMRTPVATRSDDSFAVDALDQVALAMSENPAAYGHVQTHTVARDELTTTLNVAGTGITHAHGHQWRPGKHFDWWAGNAFHGQHPDAAHILLAAHHHHAHLQQQGDRTFMQIPALESESAWWRQKTGQPGSPGVLTFTTRDGQWADLSILSS